MRRSALIAFLKHAVTFALVLSPYLGGQDRGGTSFGEVRTEIGDVLSRAHLSGSVEYWSGCDFRVTYPDFPKLRAIPNHDGPTLDLLRQMFSVDPEMVVSQDAGGRIRMIEKDVPGDLLNVKIHHLVFPPEYHGPNAAAIAILKTPEVIAFRKEHNIGPEAEWRPGAAFPSDAFATGKPSVRGDLHEVTVREALDYVLMTFPGFWFYENCQNPEGGRRVFVGFVENQPDPVLVQTKK
jgi:hypothetical protein